jgi:diguanylate cyclase (GGDEF)-like protein
MNPELLIEPRWEERRQKKEEEPGFTQVIDRFNVSLQEELRLVQKENRELKEELKRRTAIEKELMERHNDLYFIANHDPLTGLPNRRNLMACLKTLLNDGKASNAQLAIGLMDLDNFKSINDTFGHAAGDLVLLETSKRLESLSDSDVTVGRLGGDEFLIILDQLKDKPKAIEKIEAIVEIMQKPITLAQTELQVSASLGVALYPEHATGISSLLNLADEAMYQAKFDRARCFAVADYAVQKSDNLSVQRRGRRCSSPRDSVI